MSLLLSIILPVYNAEMYLKRCINSVLRQDFNNFELIIVNDGSNDKSQDICEYYSRIDNRIKLYNQINSGVAVARNTGLDKANGDYILFIDSDDWLDYDMISSMINIFTSYECDLVSCNYYINSGFDEHKNSSGDLKILSQFQAIQESFSLNYHTLSSSLWNKIFKNEIIRNHNLRFQKGITIGEDFLFLTNYLLYTDKDIIFYDEPKYHYFINPEGAVNIKFNEQKMSALNAHFFIEKLLIENNINLTNELNQRKALISYNLLIQASKTNYFSSENIKKLQNESKKHNLGERSDRFSSKLDKLKYELLTHNLLSYKLFCLYNKAVMNLKNHMKRANDE